MEINEFIKNECLLCKYCGKSCVNLEVDKICGMRLYSNCDVSFDLWSKEELITKDDFRSIWSWNLNECIDSFNILNSIAYWEDSEFEYSCKKCGLEFSTSLPQKDCIDSECDYVFGV